ncbi:MAG: hypothetical protein ACREKI_08750 [Gemmatimonadota bacterium]
MSIMSRVLGKQMQAADGAVLLFGFTMMVAAAVFLDTVEPAPALGFLLGLVPVIPLAIRWATAPSDAAPPAPSVGCVSAPRRMMLSIWAAGILAASTIITVSWLLESFRFSPAWRLAIAVLPVPAFVLFIASEVQLLRLLDEMQKRIQLEALAIAFPAGIVFAIAVEYLQKAGFLTEWTFGDVWPWMAMLYAPAYLIARRRYR